MINNFRQTDYVFRYGGEEFVVILTETDIESAKIPLERLRLLIESQKYSFQGQDIKVTVSIGLSSNTETQSAWEMFEKADKALYEAKIMVVTQLGLLYNRFVV